MQQRSLKTLIKEVLSIDVRSLALLRIGIAITVLADLVTRVSNIKEHYSLDGVMPWNALERMLYKGNFSFFLLNDHPFFHFGLFFLAALFAVSLLVGYQTKLSTIASWILLMSLQRRNPMVLYGADDALRLLLFWSLFLPLGKCWSLDQWRKKNLPINAQHFSVAGCCLIAQVIVIYFFNYHTKSSTVWSQGNAIYYTLHIDALVNNFGRLLAQCPQSILKILTIGILYLEAIGPFVILIPWKNSFFKLLIISLFVTFHVGLMITMQLGIFPLVCLVLWTIFLPPFFWKALKLDQKFLFFNQPFIQQEEKDTSHVFKQNKKTFMFQSCINIFLLFCLTSILFFSIKIANPKKYKAHFPQNLNSFIYLLQLNQHWRMFAPRPPKVNDWFVAVGTLADGQKIDLFKDSKTLDWQYPKSKSPYYRSQRWRTYLKRLQLKKNTDQRKYFGHYLYRRYNASSESLKALVSIEMYLVSKKIHLSGKKAPLKKKLFWQQHYPQNS